MSILILPFPTKNTLNDLDWRRRKTGKQGQEEHQSVWGQRAIGRERPPKRLLVGEQELNVVGARCRMSEGLLAQMAMALDGVLRRLKILFVEFHRPRIGQKCPFYWWAQPVTFCCRAFQTAFGINAKEANGWTKKKEKIFLVKSSLHPFWPGNNVRGWLCFLIIYGLLLLDRSWDMPIGNWGWSALGCWRRLAKPNKCVERNGTASNGTAMFSHLLWSLGE
jgi:hypothetical protein